MDEAPSPLGTVWQQAEAGRLEGDWERARAGYLAIVERQPGNVPALLRASESCEKLGDYRAGLDLVLRAHACRPSEPALLLAIFSRLGHFVESRAQLECARAPALLSCGLAGIQAQIGTALSLMGQLEPAAALVNEAIRQVGEDPPLLYSRARIHEFAGDFHAAERDLRAILRLAPDDAFAHWSLSKLDLEPDRRSDIDRARQSLSRTAPGSRNEAVLRKALFNGLDREGDPAEAWIHLERANRLFRANSGYDPGEDALLFKRLAEMEWPDRKLAGASEAFTPVFIVGLHRSGTTLLETLLGRHPDVASGGELYEFPAQLRWACNSRFAGALGRAALAPDLPLDAPGLGRRYMDSVSWRVQGASHLTDKLPMNFLNIGFICQALPQARILHMKRDPMDTCFSNLKEEFAGVAGYSNDQAEMAQYFAWYRGLMEQWHRRFPGRILDVSYQELVADPGRVLEDVRLFCAIATPVPSTGRESRPVTSASSAQVRGSVHRRGLGAWRPYQPWLGPMREALQRLGIEQAGD